MIEREFLKEKERTVKVDFYKVGTILWNMKYILLTSVVLCLAGAYLYIRYTVPVYKKSITILLNNQPIQYSDNYQLISSTLGVEDKTGFDNQIFILRSGTLMKRVVEQGNFNVRYFTVGRFMDIEQYTDSPVKFSFEPKQGYEHAHIDMAITFLSGKEVLVNSLLVNNQPVLLTTKKITLGESVNTPVGNINLTAQRETYTSGQESRMRITYSSADRTARELVSALEISSSIRQQNALIVSLEGEHPERLGNILNLLIDEYNILSKENNSQSILNTISFLDERILGLEEELKEVEGSFSKYRATNELLDVGSQSKLVMSSDQGYKDRLSVLSLQLNLLEGIKESLHGNVHELIPANIGITDGALNATITQYNQQVIDRNRMLAGSSENNPRVQSINNSLTTLKNNIRQSVDNLMGGYELQVQSITRQQNKNQQELIAMPSKQLALTRISRLKQVKEPLYVLLQQKREEALLVLSSLSNQVYVVDKAFGSDYPIYPKRKELYVLALIVGLIIPMAVVFILNILRKKVIFESDIVDRTSIPLLGVIPSSLRNRNSPMNAYIITNEGQDPLTESFRMSRSKLENLSVEKRKHGGVVFQVSSSGPREGKSFVSINISLSLAYLGKKVLLIGADLHKPTLGKYLGINDSEMGLSSYLEGKVKDIHQLIIPHKDTPNLDIVPAGPMPSNPSELLALPLLEKTLDELRKEYDYIVIDSAPFLVVSSGFIVSKYVDSTLYVVRSGHTRFSAIDILNGITREGSLKSVMLILNAVDFNKKSIYGDGGFGQSYTYGYGYEYSDKKGKWKW